jgi:hypothetical protein
VATVRRGSGWPPIRRKWPARDDRANRRTRPDIRPLPVVSLTGVPVLVDTVGERYRPLLRADGQLSSTW